jgi:Helix-turn-helix domain of transposase family ISL3
MTPKLPRRRLSRRAEQAIATLLEHGTQEKAAAAAGISPVTLWRLQRKPAFRKALFEARSDAFSQTIGRLQHASSAAATTLLRVMVDGSAPAASRVRAAQYVLESAARGIGLEDLEIRLRELEKSK